MKRTWWKEAIVYQIYPRSFKDSNGDGIGDLRGIISKLDYIQSLGINVIWLNPIYSSPNDDNGYDISDYRNIMKEFGTMEDFDELLTKLHQRGIKLILDLVVNHCSDEHFWFQESRKSRDNPYRDYFHWVPSENGKPNARWSFFDPEGDAWKYDEKTDAYYLHYFSQKQPDLKWENPAVRKEIYDMMHFWFKKGIDGFRMDVITFISKDLNYPPVPEKYKGKFWDFFYSSGPKLHNYLQEMNREVLSHYDIMTVAEGSGMTTENILDLVSEERQELNMAYHFDHTFMGLMDRKVLNENYNNLIQFKNIHTKWDEALKNEGWGAIYLGNHDQPRMVTRWTNDDPKYRTAASKMLNTWILSMRGTPYLYQGDEIGMTNIKFDDIEDYKDIETINWYHLTKKEGGDLKRFMESHKIIGRDNGRTPVQWNDSTNAGFTAGEPWIKVNQNYTEINVANQEIDPNSQLNYFKKMVQLRKHHDVLVYGNYQLLLPDNNEIYAYTRTLEKEKMLVVLNFTKNQSKIVLEELTLIEERMINNYDDVSIEGNTMTLLPYQAVIFRLQS